MRRILWVLVSLCHRRRPRPRIRLAVRRFRVAVDAPPTQRGELAAAHPGDHDQPHEHAPLVVLVERSGHKSSGLSARWGVGLRTQRARLHDLVHRVDGDPAVSNGHVQRAAQDGVQGADRRRRERAALVQPTTPVTQVVPVRCGDRSSSPGRHKRRQRRSCEYRLSIANASRRATGTLPKAGRSVRRT